MQCLAKAVSHLLRYFRRSHFYRRRPGGHSIPLSVCALNRRAASLDFLRGMAALAVALPHYYSLNSNNSHFAEAIAITAVEVFFVLSGFVLAPQILDLVMGKPSANLRVFLVRRWMRTIPPYLVALLLMTLATGQFFTLDFARYAGYVQNLFFQANKHDYFPVAWSLAVEEWFYISFAPLLFLLTLALGKSNRKFAAIFAAVFIAVVVVFRFAMSSSSGDWDAEVRRVTSFRVDSIAWGFLLYLALEKRKPFNLSVRQGQLALILSLAIFLICAALGGWAAYLTIDDSPVAKELFPFAAAAVGVSAVAFFHRAESAFANSTVRNISFYLGHVSYAIYLFNVLLILILKPKLGGIPLAEQIVIYLMALFALASASWIYFEKPILAARPAYRKGVEDPALLEKPAEPRLDLSRPAAIAVAIIVCAAAYFCVRGFNWNAQVLFYASLVVLAVALAVLIRSSPFGSSSLAMTAARTFVLFALFLPAVDAVYIRSETKAAILPAKPSYSFRAAQANPEAFRTWWAYYLDEWTRGGKASTEAPDPKGVLPFILIPGSSGHFFESIIHINNLGFRGRDLAIAKGPTYRIFALGESPTFGPTLHLNDYTWPELLQSLIDTRLVCRRPVEVVNAGTEAYNLRDNLERVRRNILPLKPDLVVSYHGYNGLRPLGLMRYVAQPPSRHEQASPLISQIVYRTRSTFFRLRQSLWLAPRPEPDGRNRALGSPYANLYRQLIDLGRTNNFRVVLSTSSLAVNAASPREVRTFYGTIFSPIDELLAANARHNDMVAEIAKEEHVPLIDTRAALDGNWDNDLFLDLVHFTEKGDTRIASVMFDGLLPILREQTGPGCVPK